MTTHATELKVRFYELDPYGHVNHSVYIQYFEAARVDLLGHVGLNLDRLMAMGHLVLVSRISTRFLASAELDDTLVVQSGVLDTRRVSARWAQRIDRGDQVIATQVVEVACTDREGRISRFPAELVTALESYRLPSDWLGHSAP